MLKVSEACKVLTRRHDCSSLQTACHMTLISRDHHTDGLGYGFRLLTQYMGQCQWREAHAFLAGHPALKVRHTVDDTTI